MATPKKKPSELLTRTPEELAELREAAKALFFNYILHNDICSQLSISSTTLTKWRTEDAWEAEREGVERGLIEDSFGARKLTLARICKMSLDSLEKGLKHLNDRNEAPTLPEMEKLSLIVSNLDKILRLDMGKATDTVAISASVTHTVESIRERLAADPVLGAAIVSASLPKPQQLLIDVPAAIFTELPE